jgi:uncharacterized membrane protein YbhN (UPF0104 family)
VSGVVAVAGVVAFIVIAFGFVGTFSGWLLRVTPDGWRVRVSALSATLDDFSRGLSGAGRWRIILVVSAISLASWGFESAVYILVGQSLDIALTPFEALSIAAITVLATAIPSAPAYFGTFKPAATTLAIALGVPPHSALAFAVLVHVATVIPLAIGGLVALSTIGDGLVPLARLARTVEDTGAAQAEG